MMDSGGQGQASETCVPLADLSIDNQTPAEGDTVDFAIEAKVTRIDGDMAYVQPVSVNGQPVSPEQESPQEDNSEPSFNDSGDYMQ